VQKNGKSQDAAEVADETKQPGKQDWLKPCAGYGQSQRQDN